MGKKRRGLQVEANISAQVRRHLAQAEDRRTETEQGETMIFMQEERETMVQGEYGYIVIVQDDENGDEQRIKLSAAQFAKLVAAKDELIKDANSEY